MKTLKYLLFLCAISTYSMAGWAQTTYNYTGSTNCPYDDITGTGNCSSKFLGKTIKMRVASIDGTKVTFEISKCDDGSTFSQGSTLYIKESSGDASISQVVCGTIDVFQYPNGSIVGKTTVSFPLWMDHTSGSRQYCGVIVGTTDRYYTNVLTVTAS
ncbi:MAG: hypothetical protein LBR10_13660, partial [Prevotellaceae bacterium]|nr:hypothetical protein [Prevotellaceae bacterium]